MMGMNIDGKKIEAYVKSFLSEARVKNMREIAVEELKAGAISEEEFKRRMEMLWSRYEKAE